MVWMSWPISVLLLTTADLDLLKATSCITKHHVTKAGKKASQTAFVNITLNFSGLPDKTPTDHQGPGEIMWYSHVNMEQNLRGKSPTSCGINFTRNWELRQQVMMPCRFSTLWVGFTGGLSDDSQSEKFYESPPIMHRFWHNAELNSYLIPCGYNYHSI